MAADTNQPQIILFRWRFVFDIDRDTHATSPVVGIVLLVAIAIILAVSVSTFALGIADETQEPPPLVGDSTGTYETGTQTCDDDIVRLTHVAGDTLELEETRVIVRLPDSGDIEASTTGFPVPSTTLSESEIGAENIDDSSNIFYSSGCVGGVAANGDGTWEPGTSMSFKLNSGNGNIDSGDTISVIVVHEPSESIVVEHSITVQ